MPAEDGDTYSDLPDSVAEPIRALCERGAAAWAAGDRQGAVESWEQAAFLVPEPKEEWNVSFYLFSHIAEAYWAQRDWEAADEFFRWAYSSLGGAGDLGVAMRLGQTSLELGAEEEAAEHLVTALLGAGEAVFQGEDPKYLAFARRHAE